MKALLYTGYDAPYEKLARITLPRMVEYGARNDFDFHCYTEPLIDVPNGIYWTGICGALKAFEAGYDRAIYLDVDQLVTNMDFELPDWKFGFHASRDWGADAVEPWHFSMCGFIAHKDCAPMFSDVLSDEPAWRERSFPEQGPMQEAMRNVISAIQTVNTLGKHNYKLDGLFNVHPRKVFNNVPDQVCPGKVPEPWQPGDWCAHLTMISVSDRVELAKFLLSGL